MNEEENIDQPADDRPQSTESKNISSEPSTLNLQSSTSIMEVHHHPKVEKKVLKNIF
jgi:hypothetical protein